MIANKHTPDVAAGFKAGSKQTRHNARLIAAAPELLAACEKFVAWSNKSALNAAIGNGALLASAKAALAKAKGQL